MATLDVSGWLTDGPSFRYPLVITAVVVAFAVDGTVQGRSMKLRRSVVLASLALILWMAGILIAAYSADSWSPDTFIIFACLIPLALAPIAHIALPRKPQWAKTLNRFAVCSNIIFAWAALVDAILTPAGEQANLAGHEKAFISIVVLLYPARKRIPLFKIVSLTALVVAFSKYPSATLALVFIFTALSVWVLTPQKRVSVLLRASLLIVALGGAAAYFASFLDSFYQAVNRGDNTSTRMVLWDQALFTINESPWVGTVASEPITGYANIRGEITAVPFHNSFLTLAFTSGYVGLAIFVFFALVAIGSVIMSGAAERRASLVWFPAVVAALATMAANPLLEKLGTAIPFYALLLCAFVPAMRSREASITERPEDTNG